MSRSIPPCLVCGQQLPLVLDELPNSGLLFCAHGNYGSTVFDPIGHEVYLEVVVCDECLVRKARDGCVQHVTPKAVRYQNDYRDWDGKPE